MRAVPVLAADGLLLGVISEADLLVDIAATSPHRTGGGAPATYTDASLHLARGR